MTCHQFQVEPFRGQRHKSATTISPTNPLDRSLLLICWTWPTRIQRVGLWMFLDEFVCSFSTFWMSCWMSFFPTWSFCPFSNPTWKARLRFCFHYRLYKLWYIRWSLLYRLCYRDSPQIESEHILKTSTYDTIKLCYKKISYINIIYIYIYMLKHVKLQSTYGTINIRYVKVQFMLQSENPNLLAGDPSATSGLCPGRLHGCQLHA